MAVHWGGHSAVSSSSAYQEVADYASLPLASAHSGQDYIVQATTGTWPLNRKPAGLYRSNGTTWTWLGDADTDAANISNTPAGNISSVTVQDAINELDTEKSPLPSILTKTNGYTETVLSGEHVRLCASAGGFAVVLPSASLSSAIITYKMTAAGSITLAAAGVQTVEGAATLVISVQNAAVTVASDGIGWFVI